MRNKKKNENVNKFESENQVMNKENDYEETSNELDLNKIDAGENRYLQCNLVKDNQGFRVDIPNEIIVKYGFSEGQCFDISTSESGDILLTPVSGRNKSMFGKLMKSFRQIEQGEYRTNRVTYINPETVSSDDIDLSLLDGLSKKNRQEILDKWASKDLVRKMENNRRFRKSILRLWCSNEEKYKAKYYEEFNEIISNYKAMKYYTEKRK